MTRESKTLNANANANAKVDSGAAKYAAPDREDARRDRRTVRTRETRPKKCLRMVAEREGRPRAPGR